MIARRIIGFILFFLLLILGMGDLATFIDISAACLIFVGTLGIVLVGGGDIAKMFGTVFSSAATPDDLRTGSSGWQLARRAGLITGAAAAIAGLIIMLKGLDDPAAIGPGMALALLGIFYAMVLGYGICLPLQVRLADRAGESIDNTLTTEATLVFLFAFVLSVGLFAVLMASFSGAPS